MNDQAAGSGELRNDLRTIANGLFPSGFDASKLTSEGRDEVKEAVDVILRMTAYRDAKLQLALEQLDKAAAHIEQQAAELGRLREINAQLVKAAAQQDEIDDIRQNELDRLREVCKGKTECLVDAYAQNQRLREINAELLAAAKRVDYMAVVIESAVRHAEDGNYTMVLSALKAIAAAITRALETTS